MQQQEQLIEKIASYMHDVWTNWFYHQKDNSTIDNLLRRKLQASKNYNELSEEDKEKDRKFAREILKIVQQPQEEEIKRCKKCWNCIKRDYDDEYCCECWEKLVD